MRADIKIKFKEVKKMREKFDSEIQKALSKSYNKKLSGRILDDLATAYISQPAHGHLDDSLQAVKNTRHALAREGYSTAEIDDYLIEHSYLSKTRIYKLRTLSIFIEDSNSLQPAIENRVACHSDATTTDLIIDRIKSNPVLWSALQRGTSAQYITQKLNIPNATLLKNFYEHHKDIIDD